MYAITSHSPLYTHFTCNLFITFKKIYVFTLFNVYIVNPRLKILKNFKKNINLKANKWTLARNRF